MGLVNWAIKAAVAALLLGAALYTYSLGEQRAATQLGSPKPGGLFSPLSADLLRQDLIAAVQSNAASDQQALITQYTARAPLSEIPYEVGLARALSNADADAATKFARQAMRRQPRSLAARLHGLSTAAQTGRFDQVITDYERIVDLRAIDRNILADALIGVFRGSGDWSALVSYLKSMPVSGKSLLSRLMNEEISAADLEGLIALYPDYQARYLERQLRDGAYDEAYEAWQTFANPPIAELQQHPFNAAFEDRPEPSPFNWSISQDRAELQSRGGLYVTYLGTGRPFIARQVLAAKPGDYALTTEVQGRMPENGGALEWNLTCIESNQRISNSVLQLKTINEAEIFEETLTIPQEACAFQRLDLWGRSGDFPKTSRTEIMSVRLNKFSE